MKATICDTKGCGAIIEGEQTRVFTKKGDGWELGITLTEEADRCTECGRKLFAKASFDVWSETKRIRKVKTKGDPESGS